MSNLRFARRKCAPHACHSQAYRVTRYIYERDAIEKHYHVTLFNATFNPLITYDLFSSLICSMLCEEFVYFVDVDILHKPV